MSNVIQFKGMTSLPINAKNMLKNIAEENPDHVFVIVWPNDGSMPTYHSSTPDTPVVLMRVQEFIHKYYNGDFE